MTASGERTLTSGSPTSGHFVRIAPNEVSVSHPDGIKRVLLAPLEKASWYKSQAVPDCRFQTPHSETDPKRKVARSKGFASGYTMSNLMHNEMHIDGMIDLLLGWMDKFAESGEPMNLGLFFNFISSDIMSVHCFMEPKRPLFSLPPLFSPDLSS